RPDHHAGRARRTAGRRRRIADRTHRLQELPPQYASRIAVRSGLNEGTAMRADPLIWVLADDRAGNVAQTLGVAEALGRPFVTKTLRYTRLAKLHSLLMGASRLGLNAESRAMLKAPWPDLVIAAGRRTAPVARWIKRKSPKTVTI